MKVYKKLRKGFVTQGRYIIKCDVCKKTIRHTDDVTESYAGGRCPTCILRRL